MTTDHIAISEVPFPSADTMQCPYEFYAELRDDAPVYQVATGEFIVAGYDEVYKVLRSPDVYSSRSGVFDDGALRAATLEDHKNPDLPWSIVMSDEPEHTVKRKVSFDMFKPARLQQREDMILGYTEALIDTFIDRGECEFVAQFASRLPAQVILGMFGLSLDNLDRAMTWGRYEGHGTRFASHEKQAHAREGMLDLGDFLRGHILQRLDKPTDDDLSRTLQRHIEANGELDMPNFIAEAANLFIGGIITTTHLLSTMMMLFIEHPEQQAIARGSVSALRRATEEALRVESPVQLVARIAAKDSELGGVFIPAGAPVLGLVGSANRDVCKFADPEHFDVRRDNVKRHLAFGNGNHFCMGAPLARTESVIAFERLFARMDDLRFAPDKNDFANDNTVIFRGPEKLFIQFTKR